jgi:PAS domain S-box-containing protein
MAESPTYEELKHRVKELEKALAKLKRAGEKTGFLAKVLEACPISCIVTDENAKISYVNPATEKLYDYKAKELIGQDANMLSAEPHKDELLKNILDKLMRNNVWKGELLNKKKNGDLFHILSSIYQLRDEKGNFTSLVGFQEDITDYRWVREQLKESEEKWRSLVENAPSVFLVVDRDGIIQYMNRTVSGIEIEKVVGTSAYDYTLPEYHKVMKESIKHVLKTGQICRYETQGGSSGGDLAWYITQAGPIKKESQIVAVALIATDITEHKRAEEKLAENSEALRDRTRSLEELNSALKVLLERREKDKEELEQNVVSNVKELISPYVETLRNTRLDTKQITCVEIIESNLKEIVSPFLQKLALKYSGFTPKEIQIAGLIKQGKTTKEMAELFNLSPRTIKFHRQNIRAKLGLKNQRTNLASYLLSFP